MEANICCFFVDCLQPSIRMRYTCHLLVAVVALTTWGCESPTDSSQGGSVSFEYSGAHSGRYEASGPVRTASASYALATYYSYSEDPQDLVLVSLDRESDNSAVFFDLILPRSVGEFSCDVGSCRVNADIGFDADARTGEYEEAYGAVRGTVHVTTASDERVSGTFSLDFNGPQGELRVRSGRFDLPIVADI